MARSAPPPTRDRLLASMSGLLERQGYVATGVKQIVRAADATPSSLYHFFPGGKEELAATAVAIAGASFAERLHATLDAQRDPADALAACATMLARDLDDAGGAHRCSFAVVAMETAAGAPAVERAVAAAVERWHAVVADRLRAGGLDPADADELAWTAISTLQGAELAARIAGDARPLHIAGRHLARLVAGYR